MKTQNCQLCGRELRPAPAKYDGEPTFVGFFPCPCNESYMTDCGTIHPGTEEHKAMLKRYDSKFKLTPVLNL